MTEIHPNRAQMTKTKFEVLIETSVVRITVWHQRFYRVMCNWGTRDRFIDQYRFLGSMALFRIGG